MGLNSFNAADLAGMQATQEGHMMDSCTIDAYSSGSSDTWGNPSPGWTAGSEIDCGFQALSVDEVQGVTNVPTIDAKVRLPVATSLDTRDRITVTKRFGVGVTPVTYEIEGEPKRGASGLVVELVKVTDGS